MIDHVRCAVLDALCSPRELAEALGLKPARERNKYACLACSSTDALSITAPDGRVRVHCFAGCECSGDALTLVALVNGYPAKPQGRDFVDVLRAAAEIAGRHDLLAELDAANGIRTRAPRRVTPKREPRPEPLPVYPNDGEAEAMWQGAEPVTEHAEIRRYLEGRGLDASLLWSRGLARVLTSRTSRFAWASFGSRAWH